MTGADGRPIAVVDLCGEELHLLPERAVWWPERATLFLADIHVGKDEALRAGGLPIPPGSTRDDLERLRELTTSIGAVHLVILGDFLHARASRSPSVLSELAAWRRVLSKVEILLVRGNHDVGAGDPPPSLDIAVVAESFPLGPFRLFHDPGHPAAGIAECALAGHLHPALNLAGRGGDRLKVAAFIERTTEGGSTLVLPAWSTFTGGARIDPRPGDRVWAVGEEGVVPIPTGPAPRG